VTDLRLGIAGAARSADHAASPMSPPTRENLPHPGARPRYGPTPAEPGGGADQPAPATAPDQEAPRWRPADGPGDQPPASLGVPVDPAGAPAGTLAALPEVLTAREAARVLRVGRNQLYQAVARGEVPAVRIGRTIRIPKHALLDLIGPASPRGRANGGE
jgi:excisionase family DNA binding protein